ncbi:MAG: hypothetical protein ACKOWP_06725 [Microbacteriaceae bacterium]
MSRTNRAITARIRANVSELRGWSATRWWIAATVAVVYPLSLQTFGAILTRAEWWSTASIAMIAPLLGIWTATLVRTRAELAVCDLKAVCFGICGVGIAVNQTAQFDALTSIVLSVVALAGVMWGTWERLDKERILNPLNDPEPGETCATCVPLFPRRRP